MSIARIGPPAASAERLRDGVDHLRNAQTITDFRSWHFSDLNGQAHDVGSWV
jgi:hypothetical protein